jgi:hypothetical protein
VLGYRKYASAFFFVGILFTINGTGYFNPEIIWGNPKVVQMR